MRYYKYIIQNMKTYLNRNYNTIYYPECVTTVIFILKLLYFYNSENN